MNIYDKIFLITKSDATNLSEVTSAIYVSGAGILHALDANGNEITMAGLLAGNIYPIRLRKVYSTGTTASGIFGLV